MNYQKYAPTFQLMPEELCLLRAFQGQKVAILLSHQTIWGKKAQIHTDTFQSSRKERTQTSVLRNSSGQRVLHFIRRGKDRAEEIWSRKQHNKYFDNFYLILMFKFIIWNLKWTFSTSNNNSPFFNPLATPSTLMKGSHLLIQTQIETSPRIPHGVKSSSRWG